MPTLAGIALPPPQDWQEFEKIALSALQIKWQSPSLSRNGRQGQPQAGVDIFGPDNLGRPIGVQCKINSALIASGMETEIEKAETFQPPIAAYYFATGSDTDAELQKEIRILSNERVSTGGFPVGVFFWEDLVQELAKDPSELFKHYPQFQVPIQSGSPDDIALIALLTMAFYGTSLRYFVDLLFGQFGQMLPESPREFTIVTRKVEACARAIINDPELEQLSRHLQVLESRALRAADTPDETGQLWQDVLSIADEVESMVHNVEYSLAGESVWAFRLGELLGRWNQLSTEDQKLPKQLEEKIATALAELFGSDDVPSEVIEEIDKFDPSKLESVYVAGRVHGLVREALKFGNAPGVKSAPEA